MEQQLQQALAAVLSQGVDAVQSGVTFLQAQLPDVIRQLLLWKLTWSALLFVVCVVVAALAAVAMVFSIRQFSACRGLYRAYMAAESGSDEEREARRLYRAREDGEIGYALLATVFITVCGFASGGALAKIAAVLQIWLAPKIYLIEYAASLTK